MAHASARSPEAPLLGGNIWTSAAWTRGPRLRPRLRRQPKRIRPLQKRRGAATRDCEITRPLLLLLLLLLLEQRHAVLLRRRRRERRHLTRAAALFADDARAERQRRAPTGQRAPTRLRDLRTFGRTFERTFGPPPPHPLLRLRAPPPHPNQSEPSALLRRTRSSASSPATRKAARNRLPARTSASSAASAWYAAAPSAPARTPAARADASSRAAANASRRFERPDASNAFAEFPSHEPRSASASRRL